jgi:hypothetical protein
LDSSTLYYYVVTSLDANGSVLSTLQGSVSTLEATTVPVYSVTGINVYSEREAIIVAGAQGLEVVVYSSLGSKVASVTAAENLIRIPVQTGVYIVRTGEKATKVVVK